MCAHPRLAPGGTPGGTAHIETWVTIPWSLSQRLDRLVIVQVLEQVGIEKFRHCEATVLLVPRTGSADMHEYKMTV